MIDMEVFEAMLLGLPNFGGLVALSYLLWRMNSRMMDFQEKMLDRVASKIDVIEDTVQATQSDLKEVKQKVNILK